jgi:hypothetical protein
MTSPRRLSAQRRSSRSGAVDMQAAEEPEHEKNDQYQAQTAAAEQQDDQDND